MRFDGGGAIRLLLAKEKWGDESSIEEPEDIQKIANAVKVTLSEFSSGRWSTTAPNQ